ncbi:MAG: 2Fe-2S iron-sulfur cluster binding domain-containing protein [Planctomycetes bacterium]|nr:2Fe-2S iron-sulfur cluster binding domain-containing protein [Planctomycetota bacterium]
MIYVWAIVVTGGVLAALAVLLLVAERWLVNYGQCTVRVLDADAARTIEAQGGQTLLAILQDAGIDVPASCGGKGACGYCKVRVIEGGGPVLPTEAPFLSRRELTDSLRLACQVKVKDDLGLRIPDLLEIVESMVRDRTYDATKRWRFHIRGENGKRESAGD